MKNADMPAIPVVNSEGYCANPASGAIDRGCCAGLTKREYFAAMLMQGMLSSDELFQDTAEYAVMAADALLNELEGDQ